VTALGTQLSQTQNQRDQVQQRVEELQAETARLRSALDSSQSEAERVVRSNRALEDEVAQLRAAADSAADVARANLRAVEERIKELNDALVGIAPAAAEPVPGAGAPGPEARSTAQPDAVAAPAAPPQAASGPAPTPGSSEGAPSGATSTERVALAATTSAEAGVDADLDLIKAAKAADRPPDEALTRLTADLPLEMRLQVQGLLVDLNAKIEPQGLRMTVPGASLFAINSDNIEPTAHDTLAKVAELIDAYKGHQVVIVGHTDSIGEESYNKSLSQRRANLVKRFFVDNFEIRGERLKTEGVGEAQPIASNETVEGRQANRRIDVLILN